MANFFARREDLDRINRMYRIGLRPDLLRVGAHPVDPVDPVKTLPPLSWVASQACATLFS
jgi:hypothetical protein